MPELGAEARKAIDRHLESVGDHLAAVMWECAFAIVRASDERAPDAARPTGIDGLVGRLQSEAERITDDLTALRVRSASPPPPAAPDPAPPPPAPPVAATWTPADGLAPEPFDEEPEPEAPEEPDVPVPAEPEDPEPDPPGSGRRRASMHDSPVWSLFHRTDEPEPGEADETDEAEEPEEPGEPAPSSGGNERLIELARTVEKRAGGAPPTGAGDPH
jgi:hypothetical protein